MVGCPDAKRTSSDVSSCARTSHTGWRVRTTMRMCRWRRRSRGPLGTATRPCSMPWTASPWATWAGYEGFPRLQPCPTCSCSSGCGQYLKWGRDCGAWPQVLLEPSELQPWHLSMAALHASHETEGSMKRCPALPVAPGAWGYGEGSTAWLVWRQGQLEQGSACALPGLGGCGGAEGAVVVACVARAL